MPPINTEEKTHVQGIFSLLLQSVPYEVNTKIFSGSHRYS